MTFVHDTNIHETPEAPLLDPEAHPQATGTDLTDMAQEPLESYYRSQSAAENTLPSHGAFKSKPKGFRTSLAGHLKGWRLILVGSWFNVLLVMIPIAWTFDIAKSDSHGPVLIFCLLALMPLVKLHDLATHDLSLRIGGSTTGLFNASLSNIVATVVSIIALVKCELRVVQSTLIGIILGKLLLVLGLCFFAGGIRFYEQGFDPTATQMHSSLLTISVGALLLPVVYHFATGGSSGEVDTTEKTHILDMSHGVSIILLITYVAYLVFQFFSHNHLYHDKHNKQSVRFSLKPLDKNPFAGSHQRLPSSSSEITLTGRFDGELTPPSSVSSRRFLSHREHASARHDTDSTLIDGASYRSDTYHTAPEDHFSNLASRPGVEHGREAHDGGLRESGGKKEPRLSWFLTIVLLILVTAAASVTAEMLVRSMDEMNTVVSKEWVALILLPAVTSLAESMTAVNVSVKDELSLSISIAVGGALQTALLIIPFMITLAWIMGKPLSLLMDPFESLVLYLSVQTMSHVVADGKSNWLEGLILVCLYVVIAVSFWFYPGSTLTESIGRCLTIT